MRHSAFQITNFKGIENIRLELDSKPASSIYTLVGLNESGKTTILEALHFFESNTQKVDNLNIHGYAVAELRKLIPISKLSNFNEDIEVEVTYLLDDDDKKQIESFISENFKIVLVEPIPNELIVTKSFKFENSLVVDENPSTEYTFDLVGKTRKAKKARSLDDEVWSQTIEFVRKLIPNILFFPNFLFEFPDRIYLENPPKEAQKHKYYRDVIEDVLHEIDPRASLQKHIIERVKGNESLIDSWLQAPLESTLSKMATHISTTVFSRWNKIFRKETSVKEIVIRPFKEEFKEGEITKTRVYLELKLREGSENYSISQRSLGFRWFFTFLLFTQYRGSRGGSYKKNLLFLFDEPASNLHSSAQTQLLDSFKRFQENASVIYTTHSHHLINPEWLETAFVVRNEAITYDESDDFRAANTQITIHRYRDFVAKHPDQTTYFKPILDVLDYCPSHLENVPNVVMLEGKNDFYTLKLVGEFIFQTKDKLNFMPGGGSGSLDSAIQLYIAWGRDFIVILDSDKSGKTQKQRYIDKFGALVEDRIFDLSDIDKSWEKISTEGLFTDSEKLNIQKLAYPDTPSYNKKHFNRAIQELYLISKTPSVGASTSNKFKKLIEFCTSRLNS